MDGILVGHYVEAWKLRLLYEKGDMLDRVRQFWLASYHEQLFLKSLLFMSSSRSKIVALSIQNELFNSPSQVGVHLGGDVLVKGDHKRVIDMCIV